MDTSRRNAATLTVPDTAVLLGISRAAAYEAVKRGELPVLRFGKLIRVLRAPLDRMLAGDERDAAD